MKNETILQVPTKTVRPDPEQPRKTFAADRLQELADSITAAGGIQVPLLVRPDGKNYVILDGERRWRAAGALKLETVPVLVRDVKEHQVRALQFIANQQRENLTALEEGEGYARELAARRKKDPEFGPEDLAKETGQSRATVYERLKLTRLHPPLRAALLAGRISTSIASRVAQVPDPKAQEALLKEIEEEAEYNIVSVRDVDQMLAQNYSKSLGSAPFDPKATYQGDVKLEGATLMLHLRGPCTTCKFRTGNMLAEFPELNNRPNICTQPACYAGKVLAAALEKAAAAKAKGQTVLTETEWQKTKRQYVQGDKWEYANNRTGSWADLMGKHKPEPVLVAAKEGLMTVYPREAAVKAARQNGVRFTDSAAHQQSAEDHKKAEAERKALREAKEQVARASLPRLASGVARLSDPAAWRLAAALVRNVVQWPHYKLAGKTDKEQMLARLLCNESVVLWNGEWKREMRAFWKAAGVDLLAEEQKAKAALKKEPKATPEDKAAKAHATARTRARIAAAAKARWAKIKAKAKK